MLLLLEHSYPFPSPYPPEDLLSCACALLAPLAGMEASGGETGGGEEEEEYVRTQHASYLEHMTSQCPFQPMSCLEPV